MAKKGLLFLLFSIVIGLTGCAQETRDRGAPETAQSAAPDADAINRRLGRGINLGNALDAPSEGEWGVTLDASYFQLIKQAGFDSVRIPVRWSAHAGGEPPYTIDPALMNRVEWAVDQAIRNDLAVVLNVHHYNEIFADPDAEMPRLIGLWTQIAETFKDAPPTVVFEPLNQPTGSFSAEKWNAAIPQLLAVIRASNPTRVVMLGPAQANRLQALPALQLPAEDRQLIVSVHYYTPHQFTNQGAAWVEGADQWVGRPWPQDEAERQALVNDFNTIAAWAHQHDRPMNLGEFGAYSGAEMGSRARWTQAVVDQAERHGMSWHYWEFCSGHGAYDPEAGAWRQPLLDALLSHAAAH